MTPSARVAVDAHQIGRRATGNETYVRSLLHELAQISELDVMPLLDPGAEFATELRPRRLTTRHPVVRLLRDLRHPSRRWGADLLHVQYVRPPWCDVPVVTTIHDISFEHFPETFTRRSRIRMRTSIRWSARHSAAVITGSNYTRDDLLATYDIPAERVHVAPYAASDQFRPLADEEARDALTRLDLPADFILCVGNLQPRKNLPRLLAAYAQVRASGTDLPLVLVGQRAWLYDDIFSTVHAHGLTDSVRFTGFVSDSELVALYNRAAVFVYPSLFEGFGLPVLEALACGTPTVCSSVTSIPEVAGDAAVLVDPWSTDDIAAGLCRLLEDRQLREHLARIGPRQAQRFSWARCARQHADVYLKTLAE